MYQYMKDHEAFITQALTNTTDDELEWLSRYHLQAIAFIQHERLIHLLVTFFFAFLFMLSVAMSLLAPALTYFLLDLILIILLGFYIRHYYRLENTVQHWYDLYKEMMIRPHTARENV